MHAGTAVGVIIMSAIVIPDPCSSNACRTRFVDRIAI